MAPELPNVLLFAQPRLIILAHDRPTRRSEQLMPSGPQLCFRQLADRAAKLHLSPLVASEPDHC